MAVLSLDRLSKRFGARLAVDAVSFEVREREVFGLLGPNGSGKSTILRLVTGYLYPSSGSVRIAGIDGQSGAKALAQPVERQDGHIQLRHPARRRSPDQPRRSSIKKARLLPVSRRTPAPSSWP